MAVYFYTSKGIFVYNKIVVTNEAWVFCLFDEIRSIVLNHDELLPLAVGISDTFFVDDCVWGVFSSPVKNTGNSK